MEFINLDRSSDRQEQDVIKRGRDRLTYYQHSKIMIHALFTILLILDSAYPEL